MHIYIFFFLSPNFQLHFLLVFQVLFAEVPPTIRLWLRPFHIVVSSNPLHINPERTPNFHRPQESSFGGVSKLLHSLDLVTNQVPGVSGLHNNVRGIFSPEHENWFY